MRAGKLRNKVVIQEPKEIVNSTGEVTQSWQDVDRVWCSVEPLRGAEFFAAAQTQGQADYKIIMRHRADLTPKMRLLFNNQPLDIEAVINVESRNRMIEIMCRGAA